MDMAVKRLVRLSQKEYFWIALLTLLVLAMHFAIILSPNDIVLDEFFYVNDARHIISGDAQLRAEHPTLGQLLITAGMLVFGDNGLGWRFVAVLMGSANIFLLYLICRQLTLSRRTSFLASFLLALENVTFVQSSVAMLDVFSLFFMLLAFWLYLKGKYPLAAVAGAFSVLSKLTGASGFIVIGLHWLITRRDHWRLFLLSMLLAPLLFLELLPLFDFAVTGELVNPFWHIRNMITLSGSITFKTAPYHPSTSRPWEWLIFIKVMPYNYDPDYLAVISPTLWALIIPTTVYTCWLIKKGSDAGLFSLLWFASTYLILIPLELITDRVTYPFYFFPAVGAVCIGLGMGFSQLFSLAQDKKRGKLRLIALSVFLFYLLLHAAVFVFLSPVFARWVPAIRRYLL
jgi:predicted membrane-bound dolichyl-phosphate-mannose-protein mannosyltransferase